MTYARDERLALCNLLDETGPDASTLCAGWRTVDLAAHLVLREHRPDAAAGILGGPLRGHGERVRLALVEGTPYPRLVQTIRSGPPLLSLYGLPGLDQMLNFGEFFVHHEDVRRAQPGWEPRDLDRALTEAIWHQLGGVRYMLRRVPVGIEFARDDRADAATNARMTVRKRVPMVTVTGAPAELLMWAFGRTSAARVRIEGADDDVAALRQADWRI